MSLQYSLFSLSSLRPFPPLFRIPLRSHPGSVRTFDLWKAEPIIVSNIFATFSIAASLYTTPRSPLRTPVSTPRPCPTDPNPRSTPTLISTLTPFLTLVSTHSPVAHHRWCLLLPLLPLSLQPVPGARPISQSAPSEDPPSCIFTLYPNLGRFPVTSTGNSAH